MLSLFISVEVLISRVLEFLFCIKCLIYYIGFLFLNGPQRDPLSLST
jgi:hypothetical protein